MGTLPVAASMAAEGTKPAAAPTPATSAQTPEASVRTDANEAKNTALARKRARWSKAGLDLTHCLSRETNAEIIRCAE